MVALLRATCIATYSHCTIRTEVATMPKIRSTIFYYRWYIEKVSVEPCVRVWCVCKKKLPICQDGDAVVITHNNNDCLAERPLVIFILLNTYTVRQTYRTFFLSLYDDEGDRQASHTIL